MASPLAYFASCFSRKHRITSMLLLALSGATAHAGPGTTIAVQEFEPSLGSNNFNNEFIAHIREHQGLNTALVNIPKITSDATNQPVIQARVVYTTGINTPVNTPGTVHTNWTDVGTMNSSGVLNGATIQVQETLWDPVKLEVRIKGTSISATMQQKFHAGTSIVLDGQSDVQQSFRFGEFNSSLPTPPALARNGNVQYIFFYRDNQASSSSTIIKEPLRRWTLTSSTEAKWRTAPGVMVANMLHELKPGRQFLITVAAMNGMGLDKQLLRENYTSNDARLWSHEVQIAELARKGGFHPGIIHYLISSNTGAKYCEAIGPLLFGKNLDGSEFQPGDTFTYTDTNGSPEVFEHLYTELWDRDKFKLTISCPWDNNPNDSLNNRKADLIDKNMVKKAAYQPYLNDQAWSYSFGQGYWKDWNNNGGGGAHPSAKHLEGSGQSGRMMVHAVLSFGKVTPPVVGRMVDAQWEPDGNKKFVILGTDCGPVTTWRRIRGEPRHSGSAEVLGFYIDGAPAKWASIRDINGNLADQGYIWLEKNDKSNWTGNEVITRAPGFKWGYPNPSNIYNQSNSNDVILDKGYDGSIMDFPGVVSGPSNHIPLSLFGDAPNWAEYDTGPLSGGGSSNVAPNANASANPTSGTAPLNVSLNGSSSSDSDGSITSYVWKIGGTTVATGQTANITLQQGSHVVILTVTDNDGATDTDSVTINVSAASNNAPVASASATPTSGTAPLNVALNGSSSSDSDGSIVSYVWKIGGTTVATGQTANITLQQGTHVVVLTVTDDDSATDTDSVTINVSGSSGGGSNTGTVNAALYDRELDQNGSTRWHGENPARIGNGRSTSVRSVMVIPFQLPTLPTGHSVTSATLEVNLQGWSNWSNGLSGINVDLYGINVVSSNQDPSPSATYVNGANPSSNVNAQLLFNDLITYSMISGDTGSGQTISAVSGDFASFVQDLYDNGAQAGDYVFLTLAHDGALTDQRYYEVSTANATSYPTPVLTIETGDSGSGGGGPDITETITASGEDIQLDQYGSTAWSGKNNARVGNGADSSTRTVLVMPFQLPELPAGYSVASASLSLNLEAWSNWSGQLANADLFGIGIVSASAVPNATDTYVNGSNPSSNSDAYLISDNMLTASLINTSSGSGQTIPVTSGDFASFVQDLYDGGAEAGDYVFLTLAHDNALTLQRYFELSTANSTAHSKPVLTLVLSDSGSGGSGGGSTQTTSVDGESTDIGIDGNLGTRWVGENHVRVGNGHSSTVRSVMVIPFELPALPAGHTVQSATLDLNLEGWSNFGGVLANVDLYGIGVVSSSASANAATTYVDGVNPSSNSDAQILQNNLLTPAMINTSSASSQTIPVTSANFASFVQALYNGGAQAGEYAFLTLAHDGAITDQRYYDLSSADSTSYPTPVITIESGN